MTGKERVDAAMGHREGDRVPFFCQLALGHYMIHTEHSAVEIWHDSEVFGDALITLARKYHMDGILVNLPGRPPNWKDRIAESKKKGEETYIYWDDGSYTRCPDNDNAHHINTKGRPVFGDIDPDELFYIEPHNITGIKYPFYYDFEEKRASKDRNYFPPYLTKTLEYVVSRVGNELHVSSEIFSPFTQLMELVGYSEALVALVSEPEKVEAMLGRLAEGAAAYARLQAETGPDAILVSSAFAGGGFISRDHYKRFVLPFEKYVIHAIGESTGLPVYVHTCGAIGDRIDLMIEAGYDGVDTMDPPPLGNTDIGVVKQRYGKELFLKGNIDPVNVILGGTPRDVYEKAKECIQAAGSGGGYILSSACSVAPEARPENILQMYRASIDHPYKI